MNKIICGFGSKWRVEMKATHTCSSKKMLEKTAKQQIFLKSLEN